MLLEEHFHEVEGMSYTDAHESGYEVVPDDMVIKNYLTKGSGDERFEMRPFLVSLFIHSLFDSPRACMVDFIEYIKMIFTFNLAITMYVYVYV